MLISSHYTSFFLRAPGPWHLLIYILSLQMYLLWLFHTNRICNMFSLRLPSLSQHKVFKVIYIAAYLSTSFLFIVKQYLIVWIYHILHSSVTGHFFSPHLFTIVNNATMNISIQIPVWTYTFHSLRYMPRNRSSGSYFFLTLCLTM